MENTNPRHFRAELKDYLDRAIDGPIRIQRRSGESFILVNEKNYQEMKDEIMSLQRRLLSMSQALAGENTEYKIGDRSRLKRLSK